MSDDNNYFSINNYFSEYQQSLKLALDTVSSDTLNRVTTILMNSAQWRRPVFVFGNGGSAAIAEHFSCDHTKGIRHDTYLHSHVISLSSNMPLITAIGNDYGYEHIFAKQLEYYHAQFGVALAISSSGNSPNIIEGLKVARDKGLNTIAFVGFDGGEVVRGKLADEIVHVQCNNYGIVEDSHQIIMHTIAQFVRDRYNNGKNPLKL